MTEQAIFEAAVNLRIVSERETFLDKACAGDSVLRARIEALLVSHESASQSLNVPAAVPVKPPVISQKDLATVALPIAQLPIVEQKEFPPEIIDDEELIAPPDLSFLLPSSKPGSIGMLGHYEILQVLGQGSFGIVFKAFDEKLHRHVAIKTMNPQLAVTSPPRKRFLREARSAAAVKHENVVQVYSVEELPLPYLVMEYVAGQTLQEKLDGTGPLEIPELVHLSRQIANGLAAAHAQGLIHRDIKPGNILIEAGAEQRVKITDFGLARTADDASMTRTGLISGTPMFMAPEQAQGQPLDHRADLFSLGSVLYQMASGRPPFRAPNAIAVLKRVVEDTPHSIQEIMPGFPHWFSDIISKLHAKDPAKRFQSARELATLLAERSAQLRAHGKVADVLPTDDRSSASPRSGKWIAVAVVLLAVIGLGVFWSSRPDGQTQANARPDSSASKDDSQSSATKADPPAEPVISEPPPIAVAPFDSDAAKQHQAAWAKHLGVDVEWTNGLGMKLTLIPPGKFQMGWTTDEVTKLKADLNFPNVDDQSKYVLNASEPRHPVELTQPFYIGRYEVTLPQYQRFMSETVYQPSAERAGKQVVSWKEFLAHPNVATLPASGLSWEDAKAFCEWLTKQSSSDSIALRYDLPSEAQWEYACRAGTDTAWSFGNDDSQLADHLVYERSEPSPVGQKKANPFGLFDMHGNCLEWVLDWHNVWFYANSSPADPIFMDSPDPGFRLKVTRSSLWTSPAWWSRSATRQYNDPIVPIAPIGFRVVGQLPRKNESAAGR